MKPEPGGDMEQVAPAQPASGGNEFPDAKDSALLAIDAVLTLMLLFKSEAALAARSLHTLLDLSLYRLPIYLLAWISICVFVACAVHALTGIVLLAVAMFALMQIAVSLHLELRMRKLRRQMAFPESRQGLAMLNASLKERFQDEGKDAA